MTQDDLLTLELRISPERFAPLRDLHVLRNRIAHHEPIHNRPLIELHELALTTAGWVCPVTRQWIADRSRVPALLQGPESL